MVDWHRFDASPASDPDFDPDFGIQMEIRIRTGSESKRWRSTTLKKHCNTVDNEFATDKISYLSINSLEFLDPVVEGQDLCGTHKGEVQRVEEEDQILPQVIARK